MKTNAKDYVSIAQQFFTAYDAHEVDDMLALCADGALGRYAPYGRESVVPIRGGIDSLARVSECRSEFPSQSDRVDPCRGEHSGDPSRDERAHTCRSAWGRKEGSERTYPSLLHSAFRHGLQNRTARRLLGQHRPQQHQGERRVTGRANCKTSDLRRHFSTDYMKARGVGNGSSRNQSTRHGSGSRCD
jgi:hypothetical protein